MITDIFTRRAAAVAVAGLAGGLLLVGPTPAAAETCPSKADIRAQVDTLVVQLRDDVSRAARADIRHALVESLRAIRGAQAGTRAERAALGQEIATLAKALKTATKPVRQALSVQVLALQAQRDLGPLTEEERAELAAKVQALRDAVASSVDTATERRAVSEQFHSIVDGWDCA